MDTGRATAERDKLKVLHDYYQVLYTREKVPPTLLETFLEACKWEALRSQKAEKPDAPITLDEIHTMVQALPLGNTPVPDGLPAKFYQLFLPQVQDHLI
ncbi:hypothetical protein NDU88_002109 [Pleurodeles waltl]|uniref:Uncharacterized protein n=1 Tax=Pleurodeles waltl TaxID=8319 RepID=A0AAV7T2E9_PLEWA|nr:hypothetical protein NDU88_002109 [Pleurodeles waltl]